MSQVQFVELSLAGTRREIGRAHGAAVADYLRAEVEGAAIARGSDPPLEDAWALLTRRFPGLADELVGLSEGAGLDLWQVVRYNGLCPGGGCTNVLVPGGPDGPLLAMNKDVAPQNRLFTIELRRPQGEPAAVRYGHAGRLFGYGLNERGLCVAGTAADASPELMRAAGPGLRLGLLGPIILCECATVSEALRLIEAFPVRAESGNISLLDAAGGAAVVEAAPAALQVRLPDCDRRPMCAVNLFSSGRMPTCSEAAYIANSERRLETFREAFGEGGPGLRDVMAFMRSHCQQGSICRHMDGTQQERYHQTVMSLICAPAFGALFLSQGPPCRAPYRRYGF